MIKVAKGGICMNEINLDLRMLCNLLDYFESRGEKQCEHLIKTLLINGSVWRDPPIINITNEGNEADFDDELATWLDLVAQDKIIEARKLAKIEPVEHHTEE